nr:transporter substrate-binding domain-containing protein [uncultured Desulfobulbus sp.]
MKKLFVLFLMFFSIIHTQALAADRLLRIAIEGQYPPFNFIDQQGQPKGFEIDLARELCRSIGRTCTFVVLDWNGMLPGLLAGKVDAIMASMSITEKRKKAVAFTDKYYEESGSFVIRKDSGQQISPEGLKGKKIGVQNSTTWESYIKNTYPDAQVVFFEDDNRGCFDLLSGRIDTYLAQSYFMSEWVKKPEAKNLVIAGDPVRDTRSIGEGIGIALKKSNTELKKELNEALAAIIADGTYQQIASSYFDFDIYGFQNN